MYLFRATRCGRGVPVELLGLDSRTNLRSIAPRNSPASVSAATRRILAASRSTATRSQLVAVADLPPADAEGRRQGSGSRPRRGRDREGTPPSQSPSSSAFLRSKRLTCECACECACACKCRSVGSYLFGALAGSCVSEVHSTNLSAISSCFLLSPEAITGHTRRLLSSTPSSSGKPVISAHVLLRSPEALGCSSCTGKFPLPLSRGNVRT